MVILCIYGDRAILLLFYCHQDTEYESCEIEMSISQPIFTHKIYQRLYGKTIYILFVATLHIYGALAIFILFCDRQDTESESLEMEFYGAGPILTQKNIKGYLYSTR